MTKKELAITLSKLKVFSSADVKLEQYPTDSEIAADVLWQAYMNRDIEGKTVADFGAGTGILGIGCLLLGAKKVLFIEKDSEAIKALKENLKDLNDTCFEIINESINSFDIEVDTIVQNPPFGTKDKHADSIFLKKAMLNAKTIYTFHKAETKLYIDKLIENSGFETTHYMEFDFPLKNSMKQHKKRIERVRVGCWRVEKHS